MNVTIVLLIKDFSRVEKTWNFLEDSPIALVYESLKFVGKR